MKQLFLFVLLISTIALSAQTNIICTNPAADQVLKGQYNPLTYKASTILNRPDTISRGIRKRLSPDSLKNYILQIASYRNHNTGSDTVSSTNGIGAARRWVYSRFQQYSAQNQNRLLPAYLQFNQAICGIPQHRDILAVLPGMDTSDKSIVIIEGHIDSRCEGLCDTVCKARGVEDNASGAALVLELARVMSTYSYAHTIVFMVTIGEEQGLYGAQAFATYAQQKGIQIKAVLNNDVIGGIICGQTASPPGCPGPGNLDSTQMRLFSYGAFNSAHKGLARYIKLEYKEELLPTEPVPMIINIMSAEDRTGRGGDHIPFRQLGYAAVRFTAANEDGNASVTTPGYSDRQHSVRDTLGASRLHNGVIDSFFVNFPYLARNAEINGNAAGMLGIGPKQPDFALSAPSLSSLRIQVTKQTGYHQYRIGLRTSTNDWDSVYTMTGKLIDTLGNLTPAVYDVSILSVDSNGVESLPSTEYTANLTGIEELNKSTANVELMQNKPNPFDESTYISVWVKSRLNYQKAFVSVKDYRGRLVKDIPVKLEEGMNEVLFDKGINSSGLYFYSLVIDGRTVQSKEMIFGN
ncbi:MAG TPA: M28 family peptidase [Bacteroidia bacterium]|nr:M28 family peptidase [Bacteroidia bacterium]